MLLRIPEIVTTVSHLPNHLNLRAQTESWDVGGIISNDTGQCRRARPILALRWPKIALVFCFAHDINNLVKEVLKTSFAQITREAVAAVNANNGSTSKWLKRARDIMACFASLLRVRSAMQMLARQSHRNDDVPSLLFVCLKVYFWNDLKAAERVIAVVSYRLQRNQYTVEDVVKSFGDIYLGFKQPLVYSTQRVKGGAKMEKLRTAPYHLRVCSSSKYYRRFIGDEIDLLRRDMYRWEKGKLTLTKAEEFSDSPSGVLEMHGRRASGQQAPRIGA
ncbi:hypothetical protein PC116_g21017 [Phytophthora cactorum]|uniref:Uncharacterized protein n=2 Tax=Phytophthora cactorum TaxID=29920 RepID=A0A8T1K2D0_9STRA|nr:hypothetical protein PC112_g14424 [Phytophthora cactorum]KAG2937394.1 hypothetical protein PC117_g11713 [Phytophthora cactorum]KAG2983745.1 hypothetical protein PC120_g24376 [Phytophthora cactorum]KAG3142602.1 hypothetical protein C6341_g19371 [Phytophthora cactorum]KAG4230697.1 hypothetical protein PC116_g21017 [Phytophthora cactorum]